VYVVTGATGHTGSVIAKKLLAQGKKVRVLRLEFRGYQTHELLGERDLTMTEATSVIGKAIGKPDLQYRQITYDHFRGFLLQMEASQRMADLFVEMSEALNSGYARALEPRSNRNTTPTSYEQFVREVFVPAYQRMAARA
jgi:NAD(P)-dependent dehydrogenase (short-subunit alcohol dehydrogenase family)